MERNGKSKYTTERQQPGRLEVVTFGGSFSDVLPDQLERLSSKRVYIVVSKSLAESTNEYTKLKELPALKSRLVGTKFGVKPHGDLDDVVDIINETRELDVDTIVTLGAGSISDACKTVKLGHSNNVKTRDDLLKLKGKVNFKSGSIELPDIPLNPPTLKLICIPTSLSAGEYNPKSGSLDRQTGKKFPYFQGDCMPDVIICDPFLALKTPEWVWLSTGVRSVDHAVETLCNPNVDLKDPAVANAYKSAEEALTLLMAGLMRSKKDRGDVEAREMCQKGAWKASAPIVLGIPMGGSHAIGHILGSVGGVAHGHTSCVLLPAVMEFNYPVNSKQQDNIKRLLVNNGTVKNLGLEGENDLMPWQIVAAFIRSIGMPQSLTEVGIKDDQLPKIAKETLTDFWSRTNPIPIDTEEQAIEILQLAK